MKETGEIGFGNLRSRFTPDLLGDRNFTTMNS